MRLRNIRARDAIAASPWVIQKPENTADTGNLFLEMKTSSSEIGTGKGRFIMQLAQEHPEINYIGIEKYSSVLLRCLENRRNCSCRIYFYLRRRGTDQHLYGGEIEKSTQFSDPWPKERHARRRLPSSDYLRL